MTWFFLDALRRSGHIDGSGSDFVQFLKTPAALTPFCEARNQRLIDFLIQDDPAAAAAYAREQFNNPGISSSQKRAAFKAAVELDIGNSEMWYMWSVLEERERDFKRSLDLALRVVDSGDTVEALERVGRHIIRVISNGSDQIPVHARRLYTGSIIERLERVRDDLPGTAYVTLGWLHLISQQVDEARLAAEAALLLDKNDGRAADLLRRSMSRGI